MKLDPTDEFDQAILFDVNLEPTDAFDQTAKGETKNLNFKAIFCIQTLWKNTW